MATDYSVNIMKICGTENLIPTQLYIGVTHDNHEYSFVRICSVSESVVMDELVRLIGIHKEDQNYTQLDIYSINVPQQLVDAANIVTSMGGTVKMPCYVLYDNTLAYRREYMNGTIVGVFGVDFLDDEVEHELCDYINADIIC